MTRLQVTKKLYNILKAIVYKTTGSFLILLISVLLFNGCKAVKQEAKHIQSSVTGIKRKVVLYTPTSQQEWTGKFNVEISGSTARFVTDDNKVVIVSGTFYVEELE